MKQTLNIQSSNPDYMNLQTKNTTLNILITYKKNLTLIVKQNPPCLSPLLVASQTIRPNCSVFCQSTPYFFMMRCIPLQLPLTILLILLLFKSMRFYCQQVKKNRGSRWVYGNFPRVFHGEWRLKVFDEK